MLADYLPRCDAILKALSAPLSKTDRSKWQICAGADGTLCGDVAFASAQAVAGDITPVPGGVGTVTTAVLVKHTVGAAKRAAENQ